MKIYTFGVRLFIKFHEETYTFFLALLSFYLLNAQNRAYQAMMDDSHFNFYQVCDSAEAYFKNRDKSKRYRL